MKKTYFCVIFVLYISKMICQIDNTTVISNPNNINFESNNFFKGITEENIPLHLFKGREFDLPIKINYKTDGIKVNEVAGNIGLGWELYLGGEINLIINNNIDSRTINTNLSGCNAYEGSILNNETSDFFVVNAPGLYCVFKYIIDYNGQPEPKLICLTDPLIQIEASDLFHSNQNGTFTITDKNGTKYYFGNDNINEKNLSISFFNQFTVNDDGVTNIGYCNDVRTNYTNKYLLTKIVSKNKLDEYVFEYDSINWLNYLDNSGHGYIAYTSPSNNQEKIFLSAYKLQEKRLKKLKYNGEYIINLKYNTREDIEYEGVNVGNALDEIQFLNYKSTSANPIYKKVKFNYSYFGNVTSTQTKDKRLKLDSLVFHGYDNSSSSFISNDQYSFTYYDPYNVPPVNSFAQDFMGFYNSQNSNVNLIPFSGNSQNNRNFYFNSAITGILTKIVYPNKGYKVFEYEQNSESNGYGITTIPAVFSDVYPEVNLLNFPNHDSGCSSGMADTQINQINPLMNYVDLASYPNQNAYFQTTMRNVVDGNTRTSIINISEITNCNIEHSGTGVFLIQKIENCADSNFTELICEDNYGNNHYFYNSTCLLPTSSIAYSNSNNYFPNNYILGGITDSSNTQTVILQPGKYQITLWDYSSTYNNNDDPTFRIFKFSNIPDTIQTSPVQLINNDVAGSLIDGFRIKSIINYIEENVQISKQKIKYKFKSKDEVINTYTQWFPFLGNVPFKTSKGYSNGSDIVTYSTIYIIDESFEGQNLGYKSYSTNDLKYPFRNINDSNASSKLAFIGHGDYIGAEAYIDYAWSGDVDEIKFFNANDKLIYFKKEDYKYIQIFNHETSQGQYQSFFRQLSQTSETTYLDDGKIENNIKYYYPDDFGNPKNTLLEYTLLNDIPFGAYFYDFQTDTPSLPLYVLTEIHDYNKIFNKYIYSQIPGQLNGNAVTRHLTTEVQSSKPNEPLEPKTRFDYDTDGNMVSTVQVTPGTIANNQWDSFIYGYDNRFVVAKLSGIKYSDIPTGLIDAIKAASNQAITPTSITAMETALNALRNSTDANVKNAQITTYTYYPVFGVTSVTDPKGYTVYTEYDAFGRVKLTKEKTANGDLKILSENQYNTRPN